jgi:hypothetical protein
MRIQEIKMRKNKVIHPFSSTSGKLPRPVTFCTTGAGSGALGATDAGDSANPVDAKTSPPSASNNSACFVFFDPSFIPLPLNAGALDGAGEEDDGGFREAEDERSEVS